MRNVIALLIALAVAYIAVSRDSAPEASAAAPDRVERVLPAVDPTSLATPTELRARTRREIAPTATAADEPRRADAAREPASQWTALLIEPELDRLAALETHFLYHSRAWSTLEALADKARRLPVAADEIALGVEGALGLTERVRGSLLVAAALGAPDDRTRALAETLRGSHAFELERAAWIALALLPGTRNDVGADPGPDARPLAVHDFGTTGRRLRLSGGAYLAHRALPTYPARVVERATEHDVAAAIERVTRAFPVLPVSDAELFTRELVVIVTLGPRATRPGAAREALLSWLRHPGLGPESLLVEVAAFCLAHAAQSDESLRAELLEVASSASVDLAACVYTYLARAVASSPEVVERLEGLIDAPLGTLGIPSEAQMESIRALGALLDGEGPAAEAATQVLVARILDPARPPEERYFLLRELAGADPMVRAFASAEVVRYEDDTLLVAEAALHLAAAGGADAIANGELLMSRFDGQGATARMAMIHALASLSIERHAAFLRAVARDDLDPDVRRYASRALEAAGA
jgi:hypothetical protein